MPTYSIQGRLSLILTIEPTIQIAVSGPMKIFSVTVSVYPKLIAELAFDYAQPAVRGCNLMATAFAGFSVAVGASVDIFGGNVTLFSVKSDPVVLRSDKSPIYGPQCLAGTRRRREELPTLMNSLHPNSMKPGVLFKASQEKGPDWDTEKCANYWSYQYRQATMQVPPS
jgi:hypothetical protein